MDFQELLTSLQDTLGETLPSILGGLAVLVIGWFVAIVVRAVVRKALNLLRVNERIASSTNSEINVVGGVASVFYYLILLVALIAFFNVLQLEQVSGSLQALVDQVLGYAPKLIGAGVLLLVAWIVGVILRSVVSKGLGATGLDDKVGGEGKTPLSESLGNVAFWLVMLLFLPGVLGALEMQGLLDPVQAMVDDMLGMLPNIIGAAVIGFVGWFVARILRDVVGNLLSAAGADTLGERAGLRGTMTLSGLVALLVYILVLVPALIAALNTLQIEAISKPATDMLGALMAAIPNIFGAAVILGVAWFVSGFVAGIIASLLGGIGFDNVPEKLGVGGMFSGNTTPSQFVGRVIVFFVMLFAGVEAAERLGFGQMAGLVTMLIQFGGQVLLGVVIIGVGFWLSGLAQKALKGSHAKATPMSGLVRFAILGIVFAMGLRAMGLADDIVNLAFGLTLGAIAVAVALSFGLGGREAAGKQMEHWMKGLRGE